ncbi:MAG: hypothetical protein JWR84_21 [Caulobacter sp.]|nr:hypothetical protein [Caulobacter sp.]
MRPLFIAAALALAPMAAFTTLAPAVAAEPTPKDSGGVTVSQLRGIVEGLGYDTTDVDDAETPSFEFMISDSGLDIHVLAQESESTNYIWLKLSFEKLKPGQNDATFLEQTAQAQPAHFFLYDDGTLGMAVAVENRSITPSIVQRGIDILVNGAVTTKDSWLTD